MDPQKHLALNGNKFGWISNYFQDSCYNWQSRSGNVFYFSIKMTRKKPSNPKLLFITQQH
jgi:hypothetical protein